MNKNCKYSINDISSYIEGSMPLSRKNDFDQHIEVCNECKNRFNLLSRVNNYLNYCFKPERDISADIMERIDFNRYKRNRNLYKFSGLLNSVLSRIRPCIPYAASAAAIILLIFSALSYGILPSKNTTAPATSLNNENVVDLKGRTIKIACQGEMLIPKEDTSGITDPYLLQENNALFQSEKEAEKKYNCNIEWQVVKQSDQSKILKEVYSGKQGPDIIFMSRPKDILEAILNNMVTPLDSYIDFNSGIYNSKAQSRTIFNGKHYGLASYETSISNCVLSYSKALIENQGLPDPYRLMQEGKWTWDAFLDICKKTTYDENGDGITDHWGFLSAYENTYINFILSNNGDYINQKNGTFQLVLDKPEAKKAINFVTDLYKKDNVAFDYTLNVDCDFSKIYSNPDTCASTFRSYGININIDNSDIGFVAYPKGPDGSGYPAYCANSDFYAIPSSVQNPKGVAAVMSYLFSKYNNLKPDYMRETALTNMAEYNSVIDSITDNQKYSWFIYNTTYCNPLFNTFRNILLSGTTADNAINSQKDEMLHNIGILNKCFQ